MCESIHKRLMQLSARAHKRIDNGIEQFEDILRSVLDTVEQIAIGSPAGVKSLPALNAPQRMARVIELVSEETGIPESKMCGPRQTKDVTAARRVAMYVGRKVTRLPLAEIGKYFGNRDHSTVLHACRRCAKELQEDEVFGKQVERIAEEAVA